MYPYFKRTAGVIRTISKTRVTLVNNQKGIVSKTEHVTTCRHLEIKCYFSVETGEIYRTPQRNIGAILAFEAGDLRAQCL